MYPFRATWAKDVSRHHDDLTTLASACSNGAAAIETIKRAMMDGPATAKHAGTMSAFAAIEESNAQLRKVLGAMIPSKHFNHLHSSCSSMTADKFFAVVEVTEMVCLLLEYTDLCSMQQVNKHFSALIAGSYKLQKRLNHTAILAPTSYTSTVYFDPDPAMLAKIPFPSLEGGTVYYSENRNGAVSTGVDIFCSQNLWNQSSQPGTRLRKIILLSSSLTKLQVLPKCCGRYQPEDAEVENVSGITFGDLFDAFTRLQDAHKMCPHAPIDLYDDEGYVATPVSFHGTLPSAVQDECRKRIKAKQGLADERDRLQREVRAKKSMKKKLKAIRLEPYRIAKLSADKAGHEIPTLKEFEDQEAMNEEFDQFD